MAVATLSSAQAAGSAVFGQLQTLQAERAADQAEQNARVLRQRSDDAQRTAARAQENARSLKVRSDQAETSADAARQGLAGLEATHDMRVRLADIYDRVIVAQGGGEAATVAVTTASSVPAAGTVVDTTAWSEGLARRLVMGSPARNWFLYLIECADGSIYTGIALDVAARFAAHQQGRGARYTRSRKPVRLLASVAYPDRSAALRAEYQVKRLRAADKWALAERLAAVAWSAPPPDPG